MRRNSPSAAPATTLDVRCEAHPCHALSHRKKLAFTVALYLMPLIVGEFVIRAQRDKLFFWDNFREQQLALLKSAYPAEYDEILGYVPRKGFQGVGNAWGTEVTIDGQGFRSNGNAVPSNGRPVLAVGDSFTFGDQVNDHETWPARLETMLGRPVLNAGVFGYGMDQIVLRAERIVPIHRPEFVVVGLIDDDIDRCQLSCRYAEKPYFTIENERLELRNVPVPATKPSALKKVLGYSALADEVFQRIAPRWWRLTGSGGVQEHRDGLAVCRLLLARLARLSQEYQARILLVIQARPHRHDPRLDELVDSANHLGLATLNLQSEMAAAIDGDASLASRWFHCHVDPVRSQILENGPDREQWYEGHMRADGNAWVAEMIADRMEQAGWLHLNSPSL